MSRYAAWAFPTSALFHAALASAAWAWAFVDSPVELHPRRGTAVWEASFAPVSEAAAEAAPVALEIAETPPITAPLPPVEAVPTAVTMTRSARAYEVAVVLETAPLVVVAPAPCELPADEPSDAPNRPTVLEQPTEQTVEQPRTTPKRARAAAEFSVATAESLPASEAVAGQDVDDPPRLLAQNSPPPYPSDAYRRRQEGRVVLEVHVTPAGTVESLGIHTSSGVEALDLSALNTVRGWRFEPARRAGQNVAAVVNVPVRFSLTGP
ncbi:MAG: TonB family protein [Pirellulaceae bacterium]|nr:TonB family protein [Pirellulaceae bacterium]